jgi:squalene synthase HpnC
MPSSAIEQLEIARRLPPQGCSVAEAQAYTRHLARHHYENFSVVSWLLPRRLHQHFYNVYAYCRWSDDIADEIPDRAAALASLDDWELMLRRCYAGDAEHPVFIALAPTIRACDIPIEPFADLLTAFRQDQTVSRYATWDDVRGYCRYSANPVGRLVLYLCGYNDPQRQELSDQTCTALQLANFWQDVRRDILDRDRIYIPRDSMARFNVTEQQIVDGRCDDNFRALLRFEVDRTADLFDRGSALLPLLRPSVRMQISLFGKGGRAVLSSIRRQNYDTLSTRPALSRWQKGKLIFSTLTALAGRLFTGGRP